MPSEPVDAEPLEGVCSITPCGSTEMEEPNAGTKGSLVDANNKESDDCGREGTEQARLVAEEEKG